MFFRPYRFSTLTGVLRGSSTPLKEYFHARFPNTKELQKDFTSRSGELLVDGGDANAGTVGTSFDVAVRLLLDDAHNPIDVPRSTFWRERHDEVVAELTQVARDAIRAGDDELFYRATWALGHLTEVSRSMQAWGNSTLNQNIFEDRYILDAALELAPEGGIRQLGELRGVAAERLMPHLKAPLHLSPIFPTWEYLKAEADVIAGTP